MRMFNDLFCLLLCVKFKLMTSWCTIIFPRLFFGSSLKISRRVANNSTEVSSWFSKKEYRCRSLFPTSFSDIFSLQCHLFRHKCRI
ncbi:uncharacterized protein B0P05DRAFT_112840 [Gilbertella persicaria]|uniref:uncharacterized protein n=1 Tax=Gilbertella persicaria TaxID=101096 RepID=UPI002220E492|nr:uncharacterized protein B0P05DRAFT_112840 [Gilbertella persicaria]KAI8078181.1 hypothetical protein B0P05DRAFT_112840 [Gilbertella persicaria]